MQGDAPVPVSLLTRAKFHTFADRKAHIEHQLACVEESLADKCQDNEFIESIRDQFDERGDLSDRQIDALSKFYDRID